MHFASLRGPPRTPSTPWTPFVSSRNRAPPLRRLRRRSYDARRDATAERRSLLRDALFFQIGSREHCGAVVVGLGVGDRLLFGELTDDHHFDVDLVVDDA